MKKSNIQLKTFAATLLVYALSYNASAQWTPSGSNVYTNGKVGISFIPGTNSDNLTAKGSTSIIGAGDASEGGQLNLGDPTNTTGGEINSWSIDNFQSNLRLFRNGGGANLSLSPNGTATLGGNFSLDGQIMGKRPTYTLAIANNTNWTDGALIELSGNDDNFNNRNGNILFLAGKGISTKRGEIGFASIINDGDPTMVTNMTIKNNGYIGIGTTAPSEKLEVNGNLKLDGNGSLIELGGNVAGKEVNAGKIGYKKFSDGLDIVGAGTTGANRKVYIYAEAGTTINGPVFIGAKKPTTETDYKLSVDGKIMSQEVKVTGVDGWSDFVFENDYKLKSLPEVESYIQENKHLPDVPSEKEVKTNGYDVSSMDSMLLRKIEELTLYMIDLKKENESLKTKIEALSK